MKLKIYQVDAFTDELFSGNPAAVIPLLDDWLDDNIMQKIAMENNLAETAFYILKGGFCHIRWFTQENTILTRLKCLVMIHLIEMRQSKCKMLRNLRLF